MMVRCVVRYGRGRWGRFDWIVSVVRLRRQALNADPWICVVDWLLTCYLVTLSASDISDRRLIRILRELILIGRESFRFDVART